MNSFLIALQFLTRLPVRCAWSEPDAGRSLLYYPLIGLLIGLALLAVAQLGAGLLPAMLVVAAWALLTGALHLDGLADSADAWLGGHGDRDKTLAIMKDPYCGPMGVVAILLVLGLKIAAIVELLAANALTGLVLAPVLARTAVIALFLTVPYVRPQGLGQVLVDHVPRHAAKIVLAATAVLVLLSGIAGIQALAVAALLFLALRALVLARLGGTTGDVAGALIETTEAVVLVAVAL